MSPDILVPAARDAIASCFARIDATNGIVNALVALDRTGAIAAAEAADRAAAAGRSLGPLHGLPMTLKDNIETRDWRTSVGSAHFRDHVPSADAAVLERLNAAGAIVIGKANLHELAFGGTTQNAELGPCRNPWDTDRIPGGSSGGSGAAVAAGYCSASLGTDTGGSGRVPGGVNGVLALRPTLGRISNRGVVPLSPRFDTVSPLAREAEHLARLLEVLSGRDVADPWSLSPPNGTAGFASDPLRLRLGSPAHFFFDDIDPEVRALVEAALRALAGAGIPINPVVIPEAELAQDWLGTLLVADAAATYRERIATRPELFEPEVLRRLRIGLGTAAVDYADALSAQARWRHSLRAVFAECDVIITPMLAAPAPLAADSRELVETTRALTRFAFAWALGGLPALSVPCGFTAAGLPVAFQLAAAPWNDEALIAIAALYQSLTNWHRRMPGDVGPEQQKDSE